jgi:TonB family protein
MKLQHLLALFAPVSVCGAAYGQDASAVQMQDLSRKPVIQITPECRPQTYPQRALEEHATGTVYLEFTVDATGHATNAVVNRGTGYGSGHHALDSAAAEALARCSFAPGLNAKGEPIESSVLIPWKWALSR